MAEVGSWYVTVMPNMKQFNSKIASAASTAGSKFGGVFNTALGVALGGIAKSGFDAFIGSIDRGISRLDTLESFPIIMQNVGIDAEASARAINSLSDMIDGLPTSLDAAASATQRFALQNGDVERSAVLFGALNNALLAGGQAADVQANALEQISQAYSKGKPDMMEWRTMLISMGPALKMVARSWNMSVDDMGEALRSGKIPMSEFLDELVVLNETGIDEFASLSEQAGVSTQNLGTAISLIGTRFGAAWAMILDAIGRANIVGVIDNFTRSFKSGVGDVVVPIIEDIVAAIGIFTGEVESSSASLGTVGQAVSDVLFWLQDLWSSFAYGFGDAPSALDALAVAFGALRDAAVWVFDAITPGLMQLAEWLGVAAGVITSNVQPALDAMAAGFQWVLDTISPLAEAFQPLIDKISEFVSGNGEAFAGMMERIQGHITDLQPALQAVSDAWNYFVEAAGPFAEAIAPVLVEVFGLIGSAMAGLLPIIASIVGAFLNIGGTVLEIGTILLEGAAGWLEVFQGIPGKIVGFFNGIGTKVGAKFKEIKTKAESVFNGIVTFVSSIPDKIIGFFSGIGSRITSAIGSIKFPQPHLTWTEGLFGISLPKVEWYAGGGFVTGAHIIGAGEKGTELIWPSYGGALDKYGAAIASHMDQQAGAEELIIWLAQNLGPIIEEYAPKTNRRDLNRLVGTTYYA